MMPVVHQANYAISEHEGLTFAADLIINWSSIKAFKISSFLFVLTHCKNPTSSIVFPICICILSFKISVFFFWPSTQKDSPVEVTTISGPICEIFKQKSSRESSNMHKSEDIRPKVLG